jgi:cobalamin transport system substrate-binding protein
MLIAPETRATLAPLSFMVLVGVLGAAVQHYAAPPGGLQLPRARESEGSVEIETGSLQYPREAIDSDGVRARIPRQPHRIVSQFFSIEDYLYSIVPPERVIAVSANAYQPQFSNVYSFVERYRPAISTDPEQVVRLDPDLILVSSDGRSDYTSLLRGSGVPLYRMETTFRTLEQVAATIRLTGYLTGEDAAASREFARFRQAIAEARALRPPHAHRPRILGLGGSFSYGSDTLFNDIVQQLGGVNVCAEGGLVGYSSINSEQIIRWNPEWIVAGADPDKVQHVLAKLLSDPAIALTQAARNGHVLVLENHVFLPLSPFTTRLVSAMAQAIYGNAQSGAHVRNDQHAAVSRAPGRGDAFQAGAV